MPWSLRIQLATLIIIVAGLIMQIVVIGRVIKTIRLQNETIASLIRRIAVLEKR